jgi:hypothetical protein
MSCVICHVSCVIYHVSYVIYHVSYIMCHVSGVICHVSYIMCRMSFVRCHMSCVMSGVICHMSGVIYVRNTKLYFLIIKLCLIREGRTLFWAIFFFENRFSICMTAQQAIHTSRVQYYFPQHISDLPWTNSSTTITFRPFIPWTLQFLLLLFQ